MHIPKEQSIYCPKCNTHTSHKFKLFKPGQPRALAVGQRGNVRKHKKGYGGKAKFTATVKKQNKKPTFLAECANCNRKVYMVIPKKMKKIEIAAAA